MKKIIYNLSVALLITTVILLVKLIPGSPWWGFLVAVVMASLVIRRWGWKISFFGVGFLAGFITWALGNLIFDTMFRGHILSGFGVPFKLELLITAGIVGGGLTGIAMLVGKFAPKTATI